MPDEMEPTTVEPARIPDAGPSEDRSDDRGRLSRLSPTAQAAVSTAMVLATLVLFFGYWQTLSIADSQTSTLIALAFTPLYGACFVVAVWVMVRHRTRRRLAVMAAAGAALVDTAYTAYELSPAATVPEALSAAAYTLIITSYVVAWGLARRQHRNWVNGLPIALLVAGVCQIGITPTLEPSWYVFWLLYVGAFGAGSLVCWALDVKARTDEARHPHG